ncbi:hypothetical protein SBADM41S_02640 [Streptomyces badius]
MSSVPPPGLDPELLRGHLDRERPGLVSGPLEARLIEGGRSNLTYVVGDGAGQGWVRHRRDGAARPLPVLVGRARSEGPCRDTVGWSGGVQLSVAGADRARTRSFQEPLAPRWSVDRASDDVSAESPLLEFFSRYACRPERSGPRRGRRGRCA